MNQKPKSDCMITLKRTVFCLILIFGTTFTYAQENDEEIDFINTHEESEDNIPIPNAPDTEAVPEDRHLTDKQTVYTGVHDGLEDMNLHTEEVNVEEALVLHRQDVRLLPNKDGSFELFVRHIPGRESILITDSTAEPDGLADNYTLRAYDWHATYGDEQRILNGKILKREPPLYFLMDSTPAEIQGFEKGTQWFHIHLPKAVMFGYPWGREGQFDIGAGTWISIRTFNKRFADYSGPYKDNPFVITSREKPKPVVEREKPFQQLAKEGNGQFFQARNTQHMLDRIDEILAQNTGQDLDVAIVLDTTISMKEDLKEIKKQLAPKFAAFQLQPENRQKSQRLAIVFYRDYPPDKYLTKEIDFTNNLEQFQAVLDIEVAAGGYDTPEAVYEGIDAAIHRLSWYNPRRLIIQIGDAIPHPIPRRNITAKTVARDAEKNNISVNTILLPNRK